MTLMPSNAGQQDLDMALDLLVARASLDADLRHELLTNPEAHILENGIDLPKGTQLIFTTEDSSVIVKEIPSLDSDSSTLTRTVQTSKELVSNGLNSTSTTTNEVTVAEVATAEAEATAVEAAAQFDQIASAPEKTTEFEPDVTAEQTTVVAPDEIIDVNKILNTEEIVVTAQTLQTLNDAATGKAQAATFTQAKKKL